MFAHKDVQFGATFTPKIGSQMVAITRKVVGHTAAESKHWNFDSEVDVGTDTSMIQN
jgi:hypothetical protein